MGLPRVPQIKFKTNRSKGSQVMIGHTQTKTEITTCYVKTQKADVNISNYFTFLNICIDRKFYITRAA